MSPTICFLLLVISCTTTIFNLSPAQANDELKTYIVHLASTEGQDHISNAHVLAEWYNSFLSKVSSGSNQKPNMVYAYRHVFTGFAAKMSAEQAKVMGNLDGVLGVRNEGVYELLTTRSPYFLGLRQNSPGLWKDSNYGKGTIIGLLDTGITPRHPSFDDTGVPAPPVTWQGKCVSGSRCNNKVIGVRNLVNGSRPTDEVGHGTHTSSTAAGNFVANANVFGMANGTASGMAPLAHVAMYKVCGGVFCMLSDILAGMDAAIGDGVNVLSISLGGPSSPFHEDSLAIAAFSAMQKGMLVSCAAGNEGPINASLSNEAPWILTVGASTIDRRIRTTVSLGNKKRFDGESLYQPKGFDHKFRPLVYPVDQESKAAWCTNGSLNHFDVKGKVVLCDPGMNDNVGMGQVVKDAGGASMIIANDATSGESIAAEAHVLPASFVGYKEGVEIKKYINSTSSPVATILFGGTVVDLKSNPGVAAFSSRGPNSVSPGILKPDIIGPGVDILAAWPESIDNMTTTREGTYNMIRGTSMSCPHLAGIAALLKTAHPEWSPAAIKSAIMTTASQVNRNGQPIVSETDLPADVFALGSGHVNPSKAHDPGLVFDIRPDDYIPYLCGLGYTKKQVQMIVKKSVSCSKTIPEAQLNYPSFALSLKSGESQTYSRTVTNVGMANSTYTIRDASVPPGVAIAVDGELSFTKVHQKLTYKITFTRDDTSDQRGPYGQGHITWVSGKYLVRTPFSIKFD